MATPDLNQFDAEKFETDGDYQDDLVSTPLGEAIYTLATSVTLQDVGEYLAIKLGEVAVREFFSWAERQYPELEIDGEEASKLVIEEAGDPSIVVP